MQTHCSARLTAHSYSFLMACISCFRRGLRRESGAEAPRRVSETRVINTPHPITRPPPPRHCKKLPPIAAQARWIQRCIHNNANCTLWVKFVYKKLPKSVFPVNFRFSHYEIWVQGRGNPPSPTVVSRSNTSLVRAFWRHATLVHGCGGGGVAFLSTRAAKLARKHALDMSYTVIPNRCLCCLFLAGLGPHLGRHHHACCWEHIFFQLLPILQPAALHWYPDWFRGIAQRPSLVRSTFRCFVMVFRLL